MGKCKRNIFLIVGYLLLVEILFLPYYRTELMYKRDSNGNFLKETNITKSGYMFLLLFIKEKIKESSQIKFAEGNSYNNIKWDTLITEAAILFALAGFSYILFGVVLRKAEKKGEK